MKHIPRILFYLLMFQLITCEPEPSDLVGEAPVADFTVSVTTTTTGQSVQFTDHSTNDPTRWKWNFGDGETSTLRSPLHVYSTEGIYTVTLTATNSFGSDGETKTNCITVNPVVVKPVADFTATPTKINPGQSVQFTDQSINSPTSWSWNFGDGGTSTLQSPSHIYVSAGTYTVKLTATNSSGSDDETKSNFITVNTVVVKPVADFTATPTKINPGQSVQFTDQSINSPTSWSWNFGDEGTSTLQNPSHIYLSVGNYTVKLTATNSSGSDDETKSNFITVEPVVVKPVADFTATPTIINPGQSVQFTDQSTNTPTSWSWNFGDGGTSTLQSPSHIYSSVGNYTVKLTATNSSGSDEETKSNFITVEPVVLEPIAAFTVNTRTITEGESVQFTDQSILPTSWSWDFGDGGTSTLKNPSHMYVYAGVYTVTLTVTNSYGFDEETKSNYISVGEGTSGTFTDTRDGQVYKWVRIGDQVWMAENLAYLPSVSSLSEGSNIEKHYYVYGYNGNDVSEAKATSNYHVYGVLYNWPASMNGEPSSNANPSGVQGVCPSSWHVPSEIEWIELEMFLGMNETEAYTHAFRTSGSVGGKLKETGYTHWQEPNTGANNSYGFTALPGGMFSIVSVQWKNISTWDYMWTATENEDISSEAYQRNIVTQEVGVSSESYYKGNGFSVRCIRDD